MLVLSGRSVPGPLGKRAKQGLYGRGPADRAVTCRPDGGPTGRRREDEATQKRGNRELALRRRDSFKLPLDTFIATGQCAADRDTCRAVISTDYGVITPWSRRDRTTDRWPHTHLPLRLFHP